jgi:4-hydroxybenzoate polyprenyltransferase
MAASRSPLHTWLQLFRAPNLFTVPGDPLAGFLLSSPALVHFTPVLLIPIVASLCFYAAGLLLNDLMDLKEDRAERPNRPLPSGDARPSHVWLAAGALAVVGLALCVAGGAKALEAGAGIIVAVAAYDCGLKKIPVVGALNMGLCRGLSVYLGAVFTGGCGCPAGGASIAILCYIAAVTYLARYETKSGAPAYAIFLPLIGPLAMVGYTQTLNLPSVAALIAATGMIVFTATRVWRKKAPLPPSIGALIRVLLVMQAFYCLLPPTHGGRLSFRKRQIPASMFFCQTSPPSTVAWASACLLIALWPVSRAVSKRFYAS